MTSGRGGTGGTDPMRAGTQMWQAGYQSLFEGWRQAQEFWNSTARSLGEVGGAWMNQSSRSDQSSQVLRELQEAAFAVAQAWMRLPMVMAGGAQPAELQEAVTKLTQAQGRAYQIWLESMSRLGGAAAGATAGVAQQTAMNAEAEQRRTSGQ
ncbi:MAG: hypothetical protein ACR2PL_06545 [Dehalococcoidia bacterium]